MNFSSAAIECPYVVYFWLNGCCSTKVLLHLLHVGSPLTVHVLAELVRHDRRCPEGGLREPLACNALALPSCFSCSRSLRVDADSQLQKCRSTTRSHDGSCAVCWSYYALTADHALAQPVDRRII
mmetsp:Transcript_32595/g.74747  ORF Transcript_32595/g.74747 Transcript_32595/m.74747 type:complete len:125 (-) Transcript_32595:23-397(-)